MAAKKPRVPAEFFLDVVVRSGLDVSVADAITGGELERTMEGASTLTLTLFDPHRALLRNPDLARAIDMDFGGYWWRLVKVSKSGDSLTLTFEDRDIAYLRQHSKPRAAARNKVTRAQFIRQLTREVSQRGEKGRARFITFVCPELRAKQPIGKRTEEKRDDERRPGIKHTDPDNKDNLKVKGKKATRTQRKNAEAVLDIADQLNAGSKATLALMEAVIIESLIQNLTYGDRDSIGILQLRVSYHTHAVASSIEKSVHKFLTEGFTGKGGAIALAKKHGNWTAAQVAQAVQGSGVPDAYATVHDEAEAWVDAYGGASAGRDSGRRIKKYQFRRGEPGKREDSWTAIQRLAEEVGWHAWMDKGRLYYMSDNYVMRQKARYVIDEDDDGIQGIDFDVDTGKPVAEMTVTARAKVFQVPVGSVVRVNGCGVASGRYIVHAVRQGVFDNACEIALRTATPKLPEPAAEVVETSTRASTSSAGESSGDVAKGSPKHIIDTVVVPLAAKHNMVTGKTPAMVEAANARHGATVSGSRSDHQGPPGLAWAADMSNGSSPTKEMDALARDLAKTFGIRWGGSGLVNGSKSGYRYQLIYRTNEGGNHYNHVHFGVRKT